MDFSFLKYIVFIVFVMDSAYGNPSVQIHRAANKTYAAAVVEFHLDIGNTSWNTANIVQILKSNDVRGLDIIVLPEGCLNGVPDAIPVNVNPKLSACQDTTAHPLLRDISCAVQISQVYAVSNVMMKAPCTLDDPCPPGRNHVVFNTAIVFDRNGAIIAKYRKYHLAGERGVQQPSKVDVVSFDTDFGVRFGVFICFDIFFKQPMDSLLEQGVTHFVFPSFWFNELPYLSATQVQQSWAAAKNVTLLAANANYPQGAVTGSGIYSGRAGALNMYVAGVDRTRISRAEVPYHVSDATKRSPTSLYPRGAFSIPNDLSNYTVKFLDFSQANAQSGDVCNGQVCCSYAVNISGILPARHRTAKAYSYAVAAFDGTRNFRGQMEHLKTGLQVCSLIACTEFGSKDSCGRSFDPNDLVYHRYKLSQVNLNLATENTGQMIWINTLAMDLLPLNVSDYEYTETDSSYTYSIDLSLKRPKLDLLTFAIYLRDFSKDTYKGVKLVDLGQKSNTYANFNLRMIHIKNFHVLYMSFIFIRISQIILQNLS